MSAPLKACPFCGGTAKLAQIIDDSWCVTCTNDECKGNVGYFDTSDEALSAWGMRQPLHNNVKLEAEWSERLDWDGAAQQAQSAYDDLTSTKDYAVPSEITFPFRNATPRHLDKGEG